MWVQLSEYPDYFVNDEGEVASVKKGVWSAITPVPHNRGYRKVSFWIKGKLSQHLAHRLILGVFCGKSNLQVNHKNGIKSDNRLDNLEYMTAKENVHHAWASGRCEKIRDIARRTGWANAKNKGASI